MVQQIAVKAPKHSGEVAEENTQKYKDIPTYSEQLRTVASKGRTGWAVVDTDSK